MPKAKQNEPPRLILEVAALFIVTAALLLLLALVSFDSGDLHYFKNPPNDPLSNYIGPVGAVLAGALFFLIGVASYLLPLLLMGIAVLLFYRSVNRLWLKALFFILFLLSAAAILQLCQPALGMALHNPLEAKLGRGGFLGGWFGYLLNDKFTAHLMGNVGSAILMGLINILSFLLLFEIRPLQVAQRLMELYQEWRLQREQLLLEQADPSERAAIERRKLQLEIERADRELRKKLKQTGTKEPADNRPEPRIVDTTIKPEPPPVPTPEPIATEEAEPAKKKTRKPKPAASTPPPTTGNEEQTSPSFEDYKLPPIDLLTANDSTGKVTVTEEELMQNQRLLIETLAEFGIEVSAGDITRGATITRYEILPAPGVRVERIVSLKKDLARAMKAERMNILAPIPGKDTVGIEAANNSKSKIVLRDLFETSEWSASKAHIPIAVGKDVYGKTIIGDLAEMPHLLIGGSTGSGKSVCVNCLLMSLLHRFNPNELRLIMVDPKVVELQVYNSLPHLVVPVVTDPKKVLLALRWVINEMEKRYRILAKVGVRNIHAFNSRQTEKEQVEQLDLGIAIEQPEPTPTPAKKEEEIPDRLPYIVVFIDELADLMQTSPADVESAIARLSAKARAAGIHLIIATQTPRATVITGVIKTNVPARIAFQVPSALDSRVILDENGAENLLGKGDLLYLRPGSSKPIRAQGAYVSDEEVARVVEFISKQGTATYEVEIHNKLSGSANPEEDISEKDEELISNCLEIIRQEKRASTSLLQRRLKIGYGRAAWVIDQLELRGIVGPKDGAKDREILIDPETLQPGEIPPPQT